MINKVTLVGRVGKDVEVRSFDSGSKVANFTLATSENYKDKQGNKQEDTEWHNLAVWRDKLVGVAEKYIAKGMLLYVEGKIKTRSWDDKDGNRKYATDIVVDSFKFLGKSENSGSQQQKAVSQDVAPSGDKEEITDDLPF